MKLSLPNIPALGLVLLAALATAAAARPLSEGETRLSPRPLPRYYEPHTPHCILLVPTALSTPYLRTNTANTIVKCPMGCSANACRSAPGGSTGQCQLCVGGNCNNVDSCDPPASPSAPGKVHFGPGKPGKPGK